MSRAGRQPSRPLFPVRPNMQRGRRRDGPWEGYLRFYPLAPGLMCHYCTFRQADTRDHVVPQALGGSNAPHNIVPACRTCNETKGATFPTCECGFCKRARYAWAAEQKA